jgi:lycopene cyclase domain-containing protein
VTYWALNAIFLAVVAAVALAALMSRRAPRWGAVGLTLGVVLLMTAVFDNIMIGVGLVGYDAAKISGAFVGIAPLEDFAYALAAVILLPSLWTLLAPRSQAGTPAQTVQTKGEPRA